MTTPEKVISPEKQYEQKMQLDNELLRVVRNFQKLEAARDKNDGGAKALKCLKVTELLQHEYYDVISDVVISKSATKQMQDDKLYCELGELIEEHNQLEFKIQEKRAFLNEMSDSVQEKQKKIEVMSYEVPSNVQWQQRVQRGVKTLEALENKLDTAVKQYGVLSTENHVLREEIDHMLIERINFNKLWYKLIENLSNGKKILMDVLEQAMIAYNNRDEYIVRLNALRSFALEDLRRNTQEMMSLEKRLDNDKQLEQFMGLKQQYRNMIDLLGKKTKKINQQRTIIQSNLQHFKVLLQEIQTYSGVNCESNADKFISKYASIETENMTYFNYVNDLHREIEYANGDLVYLHVNITKQREVNVNRASQQKTRIEDLKRDLKSKTKEADIAKQDLDNVNKLLSKIYHGVDALFKTCKCSKAPFLQLLGENNRINHFNVLLYLQVLEEAVNGYLANVYYKEKVIAKGKAKVVQTVIDEDVRPWPKHTVEVVCPTNPCPLCVDREMVSDVIDSIQFVDNKDDVRVKLTDRLLLPDGLDRLHNVSSCNLPKSRQIIQKRYQ